MLMVLSVTVVVVVPTISSLCWLGEKGRNISHKQDGNYLQQLPQNFGGGTSLPTRTIATYYD